MSSVSASHLCPVARIEQRLRLHVRAIKIRREERRRVRVRAEVIRLEANEKPGAIQSELQRKGSHKQMLRPRDNDDRVSLRVERACG